MKKKYNQAKIILLLVILSFILVINGCKSNEPKSMIKQTEKQVEKQSNKLKKSITDIKKKADKKLKD